MTRLSGEPTRWSVRGAAIAANARQMYEAHARVTAAIRARVLAAIRGEPRPRCNARTYGADRALIERWEAANGQEKSEVPRAPLEELRALARDRIRRRFGV